MDDSNNPIVQLEEEKKEVKPVNAFVWFFISLWDSIVKLGKSIVSIVLLFLKSFINIFINGYKIIVKGAVAIYKGTLRFFSNFFEGKWRTKSSYFVMGSGYLFMIRPFYAISLLITQVAYWIYMLLPRGGIFWIKQLGTLGTKALEKEFVCQKPGFGIDNCPPGFLAETGVKYIDNSMLILLYSVIAIAITIGILVIYFMQTRAIYKAEKLYLEAKATYKEELSTYIEDETINEYETINEDETNEVVELKMDEYLKDAPKFNNPLKTVKTFFTELLNERFHIVTLSIPSITITIFTLLPLIFMILLAFTNYNKDTAPPGNLFDWVGLRTFIKLFSGQTASQNFGKALGSIFSWTMIWAVFATFSNYILGIILAMLINKAGIKFKKMWRTLFVITIAVPQFVTLLLMSKFLDDYGPLNQILLDLGIITKRIRFLTDVTNARITVILVNIWVGVPYTMLISSGILMNIPADLYESARIDGANPFTQFLKITLPYMLFVTGPYLITQFIGNINNFNVIFFLTGGNPVMPATGGLYGGTDILVTWLFKITVGSDKQEFAVGSALGIFIFLISAFFSLTLYSKTSAASGEGDFS